MVLLLCACGLWESPSTERVESISTEREVRSPPLESLEQPQPPVFTTGLCRKGERIRVAFDVKNEKTVAVCERGERWVYRFGTPSSVEMEIEKPRAAWSLGHERLGEDAERHVVSVWNQGTRYAVESLRNEDQFDLAVTVSDGARRLARLPGRKELGIDLTALPSRTTPPRPHHWVGVWEQGTTASFIIEAGSTGLRLRDGQATYRGAAGPVQTGEASGPLQSDGEGWQLVDDGCTVSLVLKNDDEAWLEDNLGCGGVNVRFMGTFRRRP